jgi:hypothetical protein
MTPLPRGRRTKKTISDKERLLNLWAGESQNDQRDEAMVDAMEL